MEKAIVFSDLHVHPYKSHNEGGRRLKNCIAFLDYIFKLADKNDIQLILMPGDLFNNMQIMATKAVNAVAKCFRKNFEDYPEIALIMISGNHDFSEVNLLGSKAESALEHLKTVFWRNIVLLDNLVGGFTTDGGHSIWGIPYFEHSEHFRKMLEALNNIAEPNILLMHQTVGSGLPIEDDIEPTDPLFDHFSMIFNGHIHESQQLTDKFINVGSPISRDAGDIGKAKGFWIVDLDNPVESIAFKDITDKFPQFLYKTVGEELTEWESQQYVIFKPAPVADSVKNAELAEKFSTNLTPATILENYCHEVLPTTELQDKLNYGLGLL